MRSANRGNGNNVAIVNANGNCGNNNAYNGNRSAADCVCINATKLTHSDGGMDMFGTRSLLPECETLEKYGGDGHVLRDAGPIRTPTIEDVIGFDPLWDAMELCKRGVTWKGSVARFCLNGASNIATMSRELHEGTYRHYETKSFVVTSPKERLIVAQTFRDRVYHRSIVENLLVPMVFPRLIYDNAACQSGKGTDFARARFKRFLRQQHFAGGGYVLMMDVRKYYDNMRHVHVENMFSKTLPDWGSDMVCEALRAHYPGHVGYNPGSSIVQVAGVSLLNPVDHYVKERLRAKRYSRYMDDFRIVHGDREYLRQCRDDIGVMLNDIGLSLHPDKTMLVSIYDSVPYLGFEFRVTKTGRVLMFLDPQNVKSMRRRIGRLAKLEIAGMRPLGTTLGSYEGWRNHASKGDSEKLIRNSDEWFSNLWR